MHGWGFIAATRRKPECRHRWWAFTSMNGLFWVSGQFWAMRDGNDGNAGTPGNEESVTYTLFDPLVGSNPTLSAITKANFWYENSPESVMVRGRLPARC
jgi:hypothetical protein